MLGFLPAASKLSETSFVPNANSTITTKTDAHFLKESGS